MTPPRYTYRVEGHFSVEFTDSYFPCPEEDIAARAARDHWSRHGEFPLELELTDQQGKTTRYQIGWVPTFTAQVT